MSRPYFEKLPFLFLLAGVTRALQRQFLAAGTPKVFANRGCLYRKEISSDLQLFGPTLRLGCRQRNWFLGRSIGDGLNHPLPAGMAGFHVHGPSPAAAFVDLHSPLIAVRGNCEHVCECGRHQYSAQHSNQIYSHYLSFSHTSLIYPS